MIGLALSPGQTHGGIRQTDPFAAYFAHGGGQSVGIAEGQHGGLTIWSEIAPGHAACLRLDNGNAATRLSWRETLIATLRNIYPVGAMTLTGSWAQLQSSGSGLGGSYTGNRAVSTSSPGAEAVVTVDRAKPYDVWVHYTARTSGGYMRVDIDGAQTLVTEIGDPDGLGYKAFSTYSATDLQRRQKIKVATGLTGAHDIAVSFGGSATPGGNAILLEAIAISGDLADPQIMPPLWTPNTPYAMGDEVCFGGIYYSARGNGVSGTGGPTHTGGIASDGALDWRADNRPTYPEFTAIDYASEREYALRFTQAAAPTEIGGQTHGNEPLATRTVVLDGTPWAPATTGLGLSLGAAVQITEQTVWQTQAGTAVGDCQLTRMITPGSVRHDVTVTGTGPQVDMEWFYAGMLPLVRWDGESKTTVFDTVAADDGTSVNLSDFAGTNPDNIDFADVSRLGLAGSVDGNSLIYGHEAGVLPVSGNIIGGLDAFLRPNLDARTASGSLDWIAKAYVAADTGAGLSFGNGDVIGFFNRHVISMP